jgi:hypothetical protein
VPVFEFAEAGGPGVITVLAAEPDSTVADRGQGAELLGSVGPLAFVRAWRWSYACGAHGTTGMTFAVLNLARRGDTVALWSDSARAALADRFRDAAAARFKADTTGGAPFQADSGAVTLALPRFPAGQRRLALEYQITADACYACSDGAWSSYSRSVRLPAPPRDTVPLPAALLPYADTPLEVVAAFRMQPPDSAAGWSEVALPAPRRDALARLFGVTAPAGGTEYLVWRRGAAGAETVWLRGRGVEATVVGRADGVWVAAGGRAWTWRSRPHAVATTPCSAQNGEGTGR